MVHLSSVLPIEACAWGSKHAGVGRSSRQEHLRLVSDHLRD